MFWDILIFYQIFLSPQVWLVVINLVLIISSRVAKWPIVWLCPPKTNNIQAIAIHTLPNTQQSKGNQKMKPGQLIKHNMRNTFPQKLCKKWGGETSADLFLFIKVF